jgi:ATP synthase protein I
MNDAPKSREDTTAFGLAVNAKVKRKLRAQKRGDRGVWFGLGMSGLIGWSIAIPTLLGVGLGLWLDKHYGGRHSWTPLTLVAGLALGCFNAWRWVAREGKVIRENEEDTIE